MYIPFQAKRVDPVFGLLVRSFVQLRQKTVEKLATTHPRVGSVGPGILM